MHTWIRTLLSYFPKLKKQLFSSVVETCICICVLLYMRCTYTKVVMYAHKQKHTYAHIHKCAYVHITFFCICASHIRALLYMRIYERTHICAAHIWVLVHMLKIYTSILVCILYTSILRYILCIYISVLYSTAYTKLLFNFSFFHSGLDILSSFLLSLSHSLSLSLSLSHTHIICISFHMHAFLLMSIYM